MEKNQKRQLRVIDHFHNVTKTLEALLIKRRKVDATTQTVELGDIVDPYARIRREGFEAQQRVQDEMNRMRNEFYEKCSIMQECSIQIECENNITSPFSSQKDSESNYIATLKGPLVKINQKLSECNISLVGRERFVKNADYIKDNSTVSIVSSVV